MPEIEPGRRSLPQERSKSNINPMKAFPLGMVLRACPQIEDYGKGGEISNWRDLMTAAVVVRSMLGVSPSAYEEACDAM
ncbi:replication initiation protein RepC, partial [Salmonella enterica]